MFMTYIRATIPTPKAVNIHQGKQVYKVYPVPAAFDIETTNDEETRASYMYHWQFALGNSVFAGRTWDDFFLFIDYIKQGAYYRDGVLYVFIHNMDFESTFLLPRLYQRGLIKRAFAKSEHAPLEIELTNGIIFRDSAALTNMSLSTLAKNYTKTQKMVGDLDYSIARNSKTPLTDEEKQYCINDVVILKEYAEQLHAEYTLNGLKIPLTSTGIVRQYVKKQIPTDKRYMINKVTRRLFPQDETFYNLIMSKLFRGGYTHAQTGACGQVLNNVVSYDLTSAYPAQMLHHYYPCTAFRYLTPLNIDTVDKFINDGKAVIFAVELFDIKAITPHAIESKNKIIDFDRPIFENGRLYKADRIIVMLTDIDYQIYKMFYTWDNSRTNVLMAQYAHKGRLPDYLYKSVLEFYKNKQDLKSQVKTIENAIDNGDTTLYDDLSEAKKLLQKSKGMLNSTYGMTVSRLNFGMWDYGEHTDDLTGETVTGWYQDEGKTYQELISKQFLSPYYGIYVTAFTRLAVLKALKHFGSYAIYSDTDSVKILDTAPDIKNYFDNYNAEIHAINKLICQRYNLSYDIYADIGTFDFEGKYDRFKTLGAKRYIYEKNGHTEAVIAGLPKTVTDDFAKRNGNDAIFKVFRNGMFFDFADKNAHHYAGETTAIIDGEQMHELSSCYIYETSFKMSIDHLFLMQMTERKEVFKHDTEKTEIPCHS